MKNHYHTLGVDRNSSSEEIKVAYKKLAIKFHPDKNEGDTFFEEKFKQVQEAYDVLSNIKQKISYDNEFDTFFSERQNEYKSNSTIKSTHREENNTQKKDNKTEEDVIADDKFNKQQDLLRAISLVCFFGGLAALILILLNS